MLYSKVSVLYGLIPFIVKLTLICVASISAQIVLRYLGVMFLYTKQFLWAKEVVI